MKEIKKIAVIGAGAVGAFYGAKLQQAGFSLEYYTSQAPVFNKKKLEIKSIWGDFIIPIRAFSHTKEMSRADLVIISAKALPAIDYQSLLGPVINNESIIMVLQNGINTEEKLKKIFPDNMVLGALAFTCINRIAPTKIQHLDYGLVKIGSLNPEFKKQARQVAEIFAAAGIKAAFDANLRRLRWEKLLWNVPFNSLSVVCLRASTAELMKDEALLPYIYNLMYEVRLIANAEGNKINKKAIFEMVERTRKMTPYKTSMLLDFEGGREMEVEAILGEPLRLAQKYKIKAPNIESIYRILSYYNHTNIPNHSSR